MSLKYFAPTLFLLSGTAAMPVATLAATPQSCVPAKATPESYTWNFQREASRLLDRIQVDAMKAQNHADRLQTFAMSPVLSWEAHATELSSIREEVNDMGRKLCRLEVIRREAAPWQQKAIDRAAPLVRLMADNTQDAMAFLNTNQADFWRPAYRKYAANLYEESGRVSGSVKTFEEYAKVHRQDLHLEHVLGMRSKA